MIPSLRSTSSVRGAAQSRPTQYRRSPSADTLQRSHAVVCQAARHDLLEREELTLLDRTRQENAFTFPAPTDLRERLDTQEPIHDGPVAESSSSFLRGERAQGETPFGRPDDSRQPADWTGRPRWCLLVVICRTIPPLLELPDQPRRGGQRRGLQGAARRPERGTGIAERSGAGVADPHRAECRNIDVMRSERDASH